VTVALVAVAGCILYQAHPSESFLPATSLLQQTRSTTKFFGHSSSSSHTRYCAQIGRTSSSQLGSKASGSFFNQVPAGDDDATEKKGEVAPQEDPVASNDDPFEKSLSELMKNRTSKPLGSSPSTIGGVLTSEGQPSQPSTFVEIGPPDTTTKNSATNPEYDDQGYTLYANENTGEKSRVFEALVTYPCMFKIKIVGANEGTFVPEMVALVAESCEVEDISTVKFSERRNGKWTSVTVNAPVKSAEMLYILYENIDRDPRVKFKF